MAISVKSPRRWAPFATTAALCLLSLILFAIAATIVISLITLYVPTKDVTVTPTITSAQQSESIPVQNDGTLTSGTSLTGTNLASVQNQLQAAASADTEVNNAASVNVDSGTVSSASGKRKRRQTTQFFVIVVYRLFFKRRVCSTRACQRRILSRCRTIFTGLTLIIGDSSGNPGGLSSTTPSNIQSTTTPGASDNATVDNITLISAYWSRLRPYVQNSANAFGINDTGLPDGCSIEQAHILHRHAARYPSADELQLMTTFESKVKASGNFTGPLSYLNTWTLRLGTDSLLPKGTSEEFTSGTDFWVNYGRLLFKAAVGVPFYNATGQSKPILRSTDEKPVLESTKAWAKGFFYVLDSPESKYTLVTIPTSSKNNTLESDSSCSNYDNSSYGLNKVGDTYISILPTFLGTAVNRLSAYAPNYVNFSATEAFTLQLLCIYEYAALDNSDACSLFTINEWKGFEYILDLLTYYGYSFGQPAGRALGLGYLQELIARLNNQYITTSNSSVNTTLDSSAATFSLNESFFMDMTDESTVISVITALSLDYFREDTPISSPPPENRKFKLGHLTPFAARFITEKIGCTQANPVATNSNKTLYTPTQYGYSPTTATNKFVRIRLNNGILPINTIRGGLCNGRTDGLCPLNSFISSQSNATAQANYQFICFGSYTYNENAFGGDGNYFVST